MAVENPLLSILASEPYKLLQPIPEYNAAALFLAKFYVDPLATQISEAQSERQKENRKKRKRGLKEDADLRPLRLRELHIDQFKVDQVHEQVRLVLDAAAKEVQIGLEHLRAAGHAENGVSRSKSVRFEEELEGSDEESIEDGGYHTQDSTEADAIVDTEDEISEEGSEGQEGFHEEEEEDIEQSSSDDDLQQQPDVLVEDKHGLNDGFFSIDDFNRQSDFLEKVDARGDSDDGAASDEEDVDWSIDPMAVGAQARSAETLQLKTNNNDVDREESEDNEDGPTFGNMDLIAPEGFSDEDGEDSDVENMNMDDLNDESNANNIRYRDFFAPPARKGSHRGGKRGPPMAHNFPDKGTEDPRDDEDGMKRTMDAVHRDLYSDEEEGINDDKDDLSEIDEFDPKARRSNHERRQAKLLAEIRKLEAENVAKRQWTMSGEARAADRPKNSLLEEDLDFERVGKPVPVITQEVSEDIESLIRRRIVAREFNGVLRRRPDELLSGPLGRRGRIDEELQDTRSKKGLAELYEEDHLRRTDANYTDARDEKLKATHREVENLWKDIADKLDSLSSWHYRPRPVEMNIQVRSDAPVISMEDARPSGVGGELGTISQLAPQEVYRPGQDKEKGEVVTKGGAVMAREELSREEKKSRRARQKERARKAGENGNRTVSASDSKNERKRKAKANVVGDLKKGGVMVIGRKGEVVDVEGKEVKGKRSLSAGALKL